MGVTDVKWPLRAQDSGRAVGSIWLLFILGLSMSECSRRAEGNIDIAAGNLQQDVDDQRGGKRKVDKNLWTESQGLSIKRAQSQLDKHSW